MKNELEIMYFSAEPLLCFLRVEQTCAIQSYSIVDERSSLFISNISFIFCGIPSGIAIIHTVVNSQIVIVAQREKYEQYGGAY